jgi:DNA-binding LacI/PurR family transcriptional regulator
MAKKTNIRDVAALAGVSIGTVSRYLKGTQRFSHDVESRVRNAVQRLGYATMRLPAASTARAVGILIFSMNSPTFSAVLRGASRVAMRNGYGMMILEKSALIPPNEKAGLDLYGYEFDAHAPVTVEEEERLDEMGRAAQGFLISARTSPRVVSYIRKYDKPAIFFGSGRSGPPCPDLPVVGSDSYRAARMLGELLVRQRHARIGYLGIPASPWSRERQRGLRDLLDEHRLPLQIIDVRDVLRSEVGRTCSLIQRDRPDAVVCYNDSLALMLMQELADRGIAIPGEISVVGMGNTLCGKYSTPALTTVDLRHQSYGELAMQLLLREIREGASAHAGRVLLEPRLVLRSSTCLR